MQVEHGHCHLTKLLQFHAEQLIQPLTHNPQRIPPSFILAP
jgi:hypothetical protein